MKQIISIALSCCLSAMLFAQVPVGKMPAGPVLLKGGTIHTGTGEVITDGLLGFNAGKITLVAPAGTAVDESAYHVLDLKGAHVYPGFILPAVDLGLGEIDALRASIDTAEQGETNPNVRSLVAYNTDSELIPTLRFCGVTMAQVAPGGGLISGTSSVMALDGWNWEDAAYVADDGIHIHWPNRMKLSFDRATFTRKREVDKDYPAKTLKLQKLFGDALAYGQMDKAKRATNLKLEALQGLFDGSKTAYVYSDQATVMVDAVLNMEQLGVKRTVLVGARDALDVAPFLVAHKVPVILDKLHRLPRAGSTDVNGPYKLPALLKAAGVDFCLGYEERANARNLPFVAGTAVAWGLAKEDALAAITSSTARILGIADRTGSLEVGKDATIVVSQGDALDMLTNNLTHLYIRGRDVPLKGMQQRLYERYREKYSD